MLRAEGSEAARGRSVYFLTGTRADFGKLKPLMLGAASLDGIKVTVVVTGMHLLERYGSTVHEVRRLEPTVEVEEFGNQADGDPMDRILAHTVEGLSRLFDRARPDLFVVHGDRVEALAGATVGALRGIPVAHVEGGELSGTIDGILRHAISKLSHLHLVANEDAARRVVQLGEDPATVWAIGSPDIDVMLSSGLPTLEDVLDDYDIPFKEYALVIYHGITTEDLATVGTEVQSLVDALLDMDLPAVVVYPNNDPGSDAILDAYRRLDGNDRFRVFPSLRFEAFLTLLKHARVMIGNSSAGIREAPIYGIPTVNVGSRQRNRHHHATILQSGSSYPELTGAIRHALAMPPQDGSLHFGRGDSAMRFCRLLAGDEIWALGADKVFHDLPLTED